MTAEYEAGRIVGGALSGLVFFWIGYSIFKRKKVSKKENKETKEELIKRYNHA